MSKTWIEVTVKGDKTFFVKTEAVNADNVLDWSATLNAFINNTIRAEDPHYRYPEFIALDTLNMRQGAFEGELETIPMIFRVDEIDIICPHIGEDPVAALNARREANKHIEKVEASVPGVQLPRKLTPEERVALLTANRELTPDELKAIKEST